MVATFLNPRPYPTTFFLLHTAHEGQQADTWAKTHSSLQQEWRWRSELQGGEN